MAGERKLIFERLAHCPKDIPAPKRSTEGSAGYDWVTPVSFSIPPGQTVVVPSGFRVQIPWGLVGLMIPRSSMFKAGISVTAKIDCDYRGEVGLMVRNDTPHTFHFGKGERLVQMTLVDANLDVIAEEGEVDMNTERGTGGFGSTGK